MKFFIKKLLHQELGYFRRDSDEPGTSRGQYFLISKDYLDFFPLLSKHIPQDLQILNLVSHNSSHPAQVKYIYDNDKFHGSTANSPRNEHRINLNKRINPEKKLYLKKDIIIFKEENFKNEHFLQEKAYVLTRYRESTDKSDYDLLLKIMDKNKVSRNSGNYCYASKSDLQAIAHYRERLFHDVLAKDIIIPDAENVIDLNSKEGIDLGSRIGKKELTEQESWEISARRMIFNLYDYQCAITRVGYKWVDFNKETQEKDLKNTSKGLEGAHIKPRAHNGPYTQENIIPLSTPVHSIFDRGIFTIDNKLCVKIHPEAMKQTTLSNFHVYDGKKLLRPYGIKLSKDNIKWHRKHVYGNFVSGDHIRQIG